MSSTRMEVDSMGSILVPADKLWGAQTQRSLQNFSIGGETMPREIIAALVHIKAAAAQINPRLASLDPQKSAAIVAAADEVLAGKWDDNFPLVIWQTGSGTQTNMNVNEVLANRASELLGGPRGTGRLVHENDDVNRCQSSNDTFPTAISLAAVQLLESKLLPTCAALADALDDKARDWHDIIAIGRTHLMDAMPLRLGDQAAAWAHQVRAAGVGIDASLSRLRQLAIGGTAVGTGHGAPAGFGDDMVAALSTRLGHTFTPAPSRFEAMSSADAAVATSGALRTLAVALSKVAGDVRLLASGPRSGFAELTLPSNEPGSSIMPGKVNPTQCEALLMVAARVHGNDATIAHAGAGGQLQLNVMRPVLADALLQSIRLLTDGMDSFRRHCVDGMVPNRHRLATNVEQSLMLVTALTPRIGYAAAADAAHHAHLSGGTLRQAVLALGLMSGDDFDAAMVLEPLVEPGR